jgi:hypothetical protein
VTNKKVLKTFKTERNRESASEDRPLIEAYPAEVLCKKPGNNFILKMSLSLMLLKIS